MTNQEFRKEANKLFDKVEYINENSGFISAFLGLHHLKGIDKPFCSLTLRIDQYKTKDSRNRNADGYCRNSVERYGV